MGALVNLSFGNSKASYHLFVQQNYEPLSSSPNKGEANLLNSLMNLLYYPSNPRNLRATLYFCGIGSLLMIENLYGSTYIPSLDMEWPRTIVAFIKKSHFSRINETFISIHFHKTLHRLERTS